MFPQMKENHNLSYLFSFFFPDNFEAFIVSQKMSRQKLKALIVNIITILGPDENNLFLGMSAMWTGIYSVYSNTDMLILIFFLISGKQYHVDLWMFT